MSITISKISTQKNKKNRYSLYSGETFIIGISEEVLISFGVYSGCQISNATLKKIKEKEYQISIRDQGLRFLARRPHSVKELKEKLIRKGHDKYYTGIVINEFLKKGYLNDEQFSVILLKEETKLKKSGPLLIKNKLISKGIDSLRADKMIQDLYDEQMQYNNCFSVTEKKYKLLNKYPVIEQKRKLVTFLKQKGFYWEMVKKVVEDFLNSGD